MIDRIRTGLVMGLMATAGLATTPTLAGDLDEALDFVPADAALVISTHNLKQTHGRASAWAEMLKIEDARQGLGMAQIFLANEGLDAEGPAVVVLSEFDGRREPQPVIILPIKDFEKFVFGLGGEATDGMNIIEAPFGTVFATQLGEEFVAVAQQAELIEYLDADGGNFENHVDNVGRTGIDVSHASDLMIAANVQTLAPMLRQGMEGMDEGMAGAAQMGAMPAEQAEAMAAMMQSAMEMFIRDGRSGLMGLNLGEAGVSLNLGANFAEGSETAGYFQNEGDPSTHLEHLPSAPFLFAMAMDYSGEGVRGMLVKLAEMSKDMAGGAGGMMGGVDFMQLVNDSSGQAQFMGVTPGLFTGGLFANTISYTASSDPEALADAIRGMFADMDGELAGGIEYETSYEQAAVKVDGVDLDSWAINMTVDPNDPNAMQAQQMLQGQMMLMGGGGPQGYIARTEGGLYQTMSRNSELVSKALKAGPGNSLRDSEAIKSVSQHLPSNRIAEGYLDIGEVIKLVGSFAMMMGAEVPEIETDMNPVAMGLTGDNGGMRFNMFVPVEVITTVMSVAEEMGGGGGALELEDDGAEPRF